MDYEKKYKEALDRAKKQREDYQKELDKTDKNTQLAGLLRAGISAIELAFPELAESEDERIRKALLDYYGKQCDMSDVNGVYAYEVCAWLEKQKELPFVKDVVLGYPGLYFYDGERMHFQGNPAMEENPYDFAMNQQENQKEQKPRWEINNPHTTEWTKEMIDERFEELVEKYHEQKEQKPVEPSDEELERHQKELYDFKVFATKQAREHHISFVHDFEWNNFCAELLSYFNEKQKPVEIHIDNPNIEKFDPDVKITTSDSSADDDELLYVFKSYDIGYRDGKRDAEQKPAEWSERDEEMLEYVIDDVNDAKQLFATKDAIELCDKEIAWLKSLRSRPKLTDNWKPSEEQREGRARTSLPSNIDEAAEDHIRKVVDAAGHPGWLWETQDIAEAFKSGAEWMAGQGVILNLSIDEFSCGAYNACVEQGLTSEDDVIVQIRKKQ